MTISIYRYIIYFVYTGCSRRNSRSRRPEMYIDFLGLAGITAGIAYVLIIRDVLKGTSPMNIATWLIWSIVNTVVTASIIASGFTHPWMNLIFTAGAIVVFLLSLRRGRWKWGKTESVCFLIALSAMGGWYFLGPTPAIVLSVSAMCIGGIPQLRDTFNQPRSQQMRNWMLFLISCIFSLVGAPMWDLAHALYPVAGGVLNGLMCLFIMRKPRSGRLYR